MTSKEEKLTKRALAHLRDDVVEQATEACAGGGPHHDGLMTAVLNYLVACGDHELAADIANRAGFEPAGRTVLERSGG